MSSSTSPPTSSGTLNLASSPTTSHDSIDLNQSKEFNASPSNIETHQSIPISPPTTAVTDFSPQQPNAQRLPSLSSTNPLSGPCPPPPSATASPAKPRDKRATDLAAREAKTHIRSLLREDWDWPVPYPQKECDAVDWRERESDDEALPPSPDIDGDVTMNPNDIPSRKRKRHAMLQDELPWNEGLRLWHERRDCWAGARTSVPPSSSSLPTSPDTLHHQQPPPSSIPTSPTSPDAPPPFPSLHIPIPPPLLPSSNPIRASITPATYPAIYSKIVIQGLSPTVPINLSDMVAACVQGWKRDGEWPPKSSVGNGGEGEHEGGGRGRGRRLARRSVGRVKRVLGLGHGDGEGEGGG